MRQKNRWFNLNDPYQYRADNLRHIGFMSYRAYLHSDLWKVIRASVLTAEPQCQKCYVKTATQVHHRSYDLATLRGDDLRSLSALCSRCHRRAERPKDHGQTRYSRFKSAGEFMLQRRHPRERELTLARKPRLVK